MSDDTLPRLEGVRGGGGQNYTGRVASPESVSFHLFKKDVAICTSPNVFRLSMFSETKTVKYTFRICRIKLGGVNLVLNASNFGFCPSVLR